MKVKIRRNDGIQYTLDDVLNIFSIGDDVIQVRFYNEDGEMQTIRYKFPVEIKGFMILGDIIW